MAGYDPKMIAALGGPAGSVHALEQARRRAQLLQMFSGMRGAVSDASRMVGAEPAQQAAQQGAPQGAAQPPTQGRLAARRQELMAQGLSHAEAMAQAAREGLVDPKIAAMIGKVAGAVPQ